MKLSAKLEGLKEACRREIRSVVGTEKLGEYGYPSKTGSGECSIDDLKITYSEGRIAEVRGELVIKKPGKQLNAGDCRAAICNPTWQHPRTRASDQLELFSIYLDEDLSCSDEGVSAIMMRYD